MATKTTPAARMERLIGNADVRQNLVRATDALGRARSQASGRQPASKVAKSAALQRRIRDAVLSLGRAGAAAREAERKRERAQRQKRIALLVLLGAGIAAAGPALRTKIAGGAQDADTRDGEDPTPGPNVVAEDAV
ncbi:MAG: hypothetical protein M3406_15010 [Chloroflexota bacterium]|nr:hypothetical protein [Chloroflexota bacterium]